MISGLPVAFVYLDKLPNTIPGEPKLYASTPEQATANNQRLNSYKLQSQEFKNTMVGVGLVAGGFLTMGLGYYLENRNDSRSSAIAPTVQPPQQAVQP